MFNKSAVVGVALLLSSSAALANNVVMFTNDTTVPLTYNAQNLNEDIFVCDKGDRDLVQPGESMTCYFEYSFNGNDYNKQYASFGLYSADYSLEKRPSVSYQINATYMSDKQDYVYKINPASQINCFATRGNPSIITQ